MLKLIYWFLNGPKGSCFLAKPLKMAATHFINTTDWC